MPISGRLPISLGKWQTNKIVSTEKAWLTFEVYCVVVLCHVDAWAAFFRGQANSVEERRGKKNSPFLLFVLLVAALGGPPFSAGSVLQVQEDPLRRWTDAMALKILIMVISLFCPLLRRTFPGRHYIQGGAPPLAL